MSMVMLRVMLRYDEMNECNVEFPKKSPLMVNNVGAIYKLSR